MKVSFEKSGDAGLRFCDLKENDEFIFTDEEYSTAYCPAIKYTDKIYSYYDNPCLIDIGGRDGIMNAKVARIRATHKVVFVIDNEGKG